VQLNVAVLARHRGRLDQAKQIAQQVLTAQIAVEGPRDPETANALQVLAQAELAGREYSVSADHFAQALDIMQATYGNEHPAVVEPLAGLGDAAGAARDTTRATDAYRRAIAIRRRVFGPADPFADVLASRLAALGG
jgi:tetratricopeptide (TPR) repeat protein